MAALSSPPCAADSLVEAALKVLHCPDPWQKAEYTYTAVRLWREGAIRRVRPREWRHLRAPDRPARADDKLRVCTPGEAPRRGKGGSLASRQAILHSLVHIENWAVDLSWDVVARWGLQLDEYALPRAFFDDFVSVAEDECRHFTALAARLQEIGSHYGALPVHDGLWESAATTSASLPARLAVEHCCHEARGLDVLPGTVAKFANNGDAASAALLRDVIYPEEISHCAAGVRWIRYLHDLAHGTRQPGPPADEDDADAAAEAAAAAGPEPGPELQRDAVAAGAGTAQAANDACSVEAGAVEAAADGLAAASLRDEAAASGGVSVAAASRTGAGGPGVAGGGADWRAGARAHGSVEAWFHALIRANFWGALKPPFNAEARAQAGFGPEWYLPLAAQPAGQQGQPAAAQQAAKEPGQGQVAAAPAAAEAAA